MAYNNGFPIGYQYIQQPMMVQPVQPIPQVQPVQQATQAQYPAAQGGFVRVRSENEARMYPVAPGNSVTFIDETGPFCYAKTVNIGQLDRPIFEKYRLVKEDDAPAATEGAHAPAETPSIDLSAFVTKDDFDAFRADIDAVKQDIDAMRGDLYGLAGKKKAVKKEATADE